MNWVKVVGSDKRYPTLLEDNGDGTYTAWGYSVWGPGGRRGELQTGVEVMPVATKADREAMARKEAMMERALRSQAALVAGMRAARGAVER